MGLEHLTVKENKELLKKEKGRGKKKKKRWPVEIALKSWVPVQHMEHTPYWWKTHRIGFSH